VSEPVALLLLPRPLGRFEPLREVAEDLLRAPQVHAVEPGRVPYGSAGRLPPTLGRLLAAVWFRRLRLPGRPRAVVIFHPFQFPLAEALLARFPDCELWYYRWDRFEAAFEPIYYDRPRLRRRIAALHEAVSERSALTFAISEKLVEQEREAGRSAVLVPVTADSFPASDPEAGVIAVSLGYLGWRTDWRLLREIADSMPELTILLVGGWSEKRCRDDPDFQACRRMPGLIWLGYLTDEQASRLILCADVGILPLKQDAYNDAGLPVRILKFARLGRWTITPDLAGARTWRRAIQPMSDPDEWIDALRGQAGARSRPDLELRQWALSQSAEVSHAPLWERLSTLGIEAPGSRG
jgi:hypothetical protein